jgi:hypothetical protein
LLSLLPLLSLLSLLSMSMHPSTLKIPIDYRSKYRY